MRSRFYLADIQLVELLDVAKDLAELSAKLLLFFRSKAQSSEVSDVLNI